MPLCHMCNVNVDNHRCIAPKTILLKTPMSIATSIALLILLACCALLIFVIAKASLSKSLQQEPLHVRLPSSIPAGFELRLSEAIKYKTVSSDDQPIDRAAFQTFVEYIKATFPLVFAKSNVKHFNEHSLLISIDGSEPDCQPVVLMAHYDVVPVESSTLEQWEQPPFSGALFGGFIYGRGTLDDKCSLMGILESVAWLLKENITLRAPLLIAVGHDEEIGGQGAAVIAEYIKSKYGQLRVVLDEGGVIAQDLVPGLESQAVALVGTAEKGHATFQLHCSSSQGHASMPERDGAIARIARAIYNIQKQSNSFKITPPVEGFFKYLGPEMPFFQRIVFANTWLFKKLIFRMYSKKGSTRALISTTYAPTVVRAGNKSNVLPSGAKAAINVRILPGETIAGCLAHLGTMIDDPDIQISVMPFANDPPAVTEDESDDFRLLGRVIRTVFNDTLVSPYLTIATTDSRHYSGFARHVFRFLPLPFENIDLPRIHGINERIRITDYERSIVFYRMFIEQFAGRQTHSE